VSLGGEHAEDVREGLQETCDALVLERPTHVVHVYARRCNRPHDPFGVRDIDIDRARQSAVVLKRSDRVFRECVDRVGTDELVDVEGVGIARILG